MLIEVTGTFCVKNIRYLRQKYTLSRRALANLIGMRPSLMKMIEEGRSAEIFSKREIKRICDIFEVPMEELIHKDLCK